MLLDMLTVVEELREKFPEHFQTLVRVPAPSKRSTMTSVLISSVRRGQRGV